MQAQVKYESEFKTAVLGDRTITVKNVTPIYPPQERDKRDREIERRLFDVFVKYAGRVWKSRYRRHDPFGEIRARKQRAVLRNLPRYANRRYRVRKRRRRNQ